MSSSTDFLQLYKYNVTLKLHIFTLLYQTKRAGSLTKFQIIRKLTIYHTWIFH